VGYENSVEDLSLRLSFALSDYSKDGFSGLAQDSSSKSELRKKPKQYPFFQSRPDGALELL
jgi:hypothetical protein